MKYLKYKNMWSLVQLFYVKLTLYKKELFSKRGDVPTESQLIKLKDKIPIKEKTDVVYKIHCNDCDRKYIGETGRNLTTRLSEHQRDIRNSKEQSQVFQHVRDNDHNFNFSEPEIIHRSANIFVRRKLEAFYSQ